MENKQSPDIIYKLNFKNGQVRAVPFEQIVSQLNISTAGKNNEMQQILMS